jgi:DNA mismatch repair protein MutL
VENLFFNTPARRKFLKAETTEARHISRTATALAIGRHEIGFSYTMNGREIFSLPHDMSLEERVRGLLGPGKRFVPVEGEYGPVTIRGGIGLPDMAVTNRLGQYLFINGRWVQAPSLAHAFGAGYGEMVPKGNFPVGALLLAVDPLEVDVNVHPAKTEVRLSHEREIYDAIYRTIRDSLRQDGIIPSFHPVGGHESVTGQKETGRNDPHGIPGIASSAAVNKSFMSELYRPADVGLRSAETFVRINRDTGEIIEEQSAAAQTVPTEVRSGSEEEGPSGGIRLVGRFSDLYLLLQAGDNLYIVDQHTAHERVLFEQMLRQVDSHSVVGQHLLLPVQIELSPEQMSVFEEAEQLLNESGFGIAHFGGRTVNVEAVPSVLSRKSPEKIVRKVIDDLSSLQKAGYDLKKAMAQSIACRAAVMSGDRLNDREAEGLLAQLLKCDNMYTCPHGRPTFIKIDRTTLDKQFGRA